MKTRKMIVGIAVFILFYAGISGGTTYYVDPNGSNDSDGLSWATAFKTIQKGIDSSVNGDIVDVNEGTYYEDIDFNGKDITVSGTKAAVIDGNGATNVVTFGAGSEAILSGLSITGGTRGVYAGSSSAPTIRSCFIYDNEVGVLFDSSEGTARNNTIVDNSSYGIQAVSTSPVISNCILWSNGDDLYDCNATYSCIKDGNAGTGNLSSYPFFVDYDANDFHLTWNSPCINRGDPNGTYTGETDIDGENRVFEEKYYSSRVEMGADEFDSINDNLVQNPGFELGGGGLDGNDPNVPLHWLDGTLSAISIDNTEYHSDGNSCKSICDGSNWVGLYSDFIPVDTNKMYTFSAWIKGQTGDEKLNLKWTEYPDTNGSPDDVNSSGSFYFYYEATTYWRPWRKMFTPDVNTTTQFISLGLLSKYGDGTVWIDDVNIIENIPEFLPAYGCVNEPNLAFTIKFGGSELNTNYISDFNTRMTDPCTDEDDNNITYRALKTTGQSIYIHIPAFNTDATTGLPLTPMLLEIMYKDTIPNTNVEVMSKTGFIYLDPNYGVNPDNLGRIIGHLGDCNDGKWKYIQYAFQKSDFQLLRSVDGEFNLVITSPSASEVPINYISLRVITQEDYEALTNKQKDMMGFYEIEMPTNNPSNPNYTDPNLTVFVRDIMHPVYKTTKPEVNEPKSISTFGAWDEVEPVCFSIYSVNGVNDLTITVSNLTNGDSNISNSNVTAYQVIHSEKRLDCRPSILDYSLLPDYIAEFNNLSVEPNTSETVWLKINIPDVNAGLSAGLYTGQITIARPGKPNVYVPIDINVYDITLDEPNSTNPICSGTWFYLSSSLDNVYSMVSEAGFDPFGSGGDYMTGGLKLISYSGDPCDSNNIIFDDNDFKNSIEKARAEGFLRNHIMLSVADSYAGDLYELATDKTYNTSDTNLWDDLSDPCFVYWFGKLIDKYEEIGDICDINFAYFLYDEPYSHPDRRIICDRLGTIICDPNHHGLTAVSYSTNCETPCPNDCGGQDICPEEGYYNVPTTDGNIPELTELIDYKIWAFFDGGEGAGYVKHQDPCYHGQFGYVNSFSQNCNPVYNRFYHGLFAWRTGAAIVLGYQLGYGINDPYNDFDLKYSIRFSDDSHYYADFLYSYPTWSGKIWYGIGGIEATREGIKDARYFTTLKRLIAEEPNDLVAQDAQEYLNGLEYIIDTDYGSYEDQSTELGHYQAIIKAISPTSDPNDFEAFTEIRKKIADYIVLIQDGNDYRCHNINKDEWYTTIQNAINGADACDTVIVADGNYSGAGNRDIDFGGKAITVKSANGPENCIINCEGSRGTPRCGFIFDSSEGSSSVLDGFTITNGYGHYIAMDGMYAGGAIQCSYGSSPTIRRCILKDNMNDKTNSDTYGGAIASYAEGPCGINPLIENCVIYDNEAYYGGGISVFGSSATIRNCMIWDNSANRGGGIDLNYGSSVDINNCTIVNNSASTGGGINSYNSTETIVNCILWGNGDDLYDCNATYSCIEDNDSGTGNIHSDPCFVDADSNGFHIDIHSPCVNAGDPNGNYDGQTDIDGDARVIDSYVDMGADEVNAPAPDSHWWRLDETSGTTAYDSVDTNNGAFNGDDPCWVTGKFGGAVDFNGVNDYFSVSSLDDIYNNESVFTVAGWFKTTQSMGKQTIVGQWSQNSDYYYGWQVLVENNKVVAKFGGDAAGLTVITGTSDVTNGGWHHFAIVNNGSSSTVLYVDGQSQGTTGAKSMNTSDYDTKFRIGDGSYGSGTLEGGPFNGIIDDVMLFNRVLSAGEVEQLYEEGLE